MAKSNLEYLLKEKYGYSDTEIFLLLQDDPDLKNVANDIKEDIKLLKKNYPLAYIIGNIEFLGAKIDLSQRTLIPRPETEYLTGKVLQDISPEEKLEVLDLFTGSGCIGIATMRQRKDCFISFVDKNPKAIKQVEINLKLNDIKKNFEIIKSDLFSKLKNRTFDIIFANPPYVDPTDPKLPKELEYEPKDALFAENNGLAIIEKFLDEAPSHLNEEGTIYMEFGETQKDAIEELLKRFGYKDWEFNKDQFGKWRWIEILA